MFVYSVNALDKYMCYVQDSLEEQASQGSFVPHGRQDVLTAAIDDQNTQVMCVLLELV